MRFARRALLVMSAALIVQSLFACAAPEQRRTVDRDQKGRPIEDVSSVRPKQEAVQPERDLVAVRRMKRVESVGDCAPLYKNGQRGACINDKPCRGFGVVDEAGVVSCTCYGQAGGCGENQRCDDKKVVCVPEDEPSFDRPRTP
jgi:hypothetical protein